MIIANNPWKGVVPYSDDAEDLIAHPFRGRDKAIKELLTIISNNEITTLYGRSGIGKTSLLNAGLFPKLRENGCWPVSIRLYNDCADKHYASHIIERLSPVGHVINEVDSSTDYESAQILWDYFSNHSFSVDGQEVVPIIVLDQFEEILRNTPDEALTLLRQIREAKQEGYREDGSRYEVNFRFVISIREDDLYLLENVLDINYIDKMKTGRYRLQPVEREAAYEIVFINDALYGNIDERERYEIVDKLIRLTTQDGAISSIMLSLVCSMAYNAATNGIITLETINKLGDLPLVSFYKDCIKGLPDRFVDYLENTFVDYDRRRSVPQDRIPAAYINYVNLLADEKSDHHILTVSSDKNNKSLSYELIHDKLADAISKYHDERLTELTFNRRKRIIRKTSIFTGVALFTYILLFTIVKLTGRPIIYEYQGDLNGDTINVYNRVYYVKDGFLKLTNCTIPEYAFYGNQEVRKVELDGVFNSDNGLYLPNADTLIIGSKQWKDPVEPHSMPNIKVVIAHKPDVSSVFPLTKTFCNLDTVLIAPEDSDFIKWDWKTKTLFARSDINHIFEPYLSRFVKAYKSIDIRTDYDVYSISNYDLAHPDKYSREDGMYYYVVNTDTSKHVLHCKEIPDYIVQRIKFLDLKYIDTICDGSFCFPTSYSVVEVSLPDARYIGKSAFQNMNIDGRLLLPKAETISDSAFYKSSFDSINLKSAKRIGKNAFMLSKYDSKAKKIELPMVEEIGDSAFSYRIDNNTYFSYNRNFNLESGKEDLIFGGKFYNHGLTTIPGEKKETALINNGYHVEEGILVLDSANIEKLVIGRNIKEIKVNNKINRLSVSKIISHNTKGFYTFKGFLFQRGKIILRPNVRTVVSFRYKENLLVRCSSDKCQNYICLNRNDIPTHRNTKDINLYVPYGQIASYYGYKDIFKTVNEMSWIKTLHYKVCYGALYQQLKIRLLYDSVEFDDVVWIMACIIIMFMSLLILKHWNRIKWTRDIIAMSLIVVISFLLFSPFFVDGITEYVTSDGKRFTQIVALYDYIRTHDAVIEYSHITMRPGLYLALVLWTGYLIVVNRIGRKRIVDDKKNDV